MSTINKKPFRKHVQKKKSHKLRYDIDHIMAGEKDTDIEDIAGDARYIRLKRDRLIPSNKKEILTKFMIDIYNISPSNEKEYREAFVTIRKKHKIQPKKAQISYLYRVAVQEGRLKKNKILETLLITKKMRSGSGVLVVSVIMGPEKFSCAHNCYFCPNWPGLARSYIPHEPTVERGRRNNFSARLQMTERLMTYFINGHPIDKLEIIILGGTFSCYPRDIATKFIRDLYYTANTFFDREKRKSFSLRKEISINASAECSVIGVTVETRPDYIKPEELSWFRSLGVTRVQIGAQTTDDRILKKLNRGCTNQDTKNAIRLLKDSCFKVDLHWMPDLPGTTYEKDKELFIEIFNDHDLRGDQWKIYPLEVTEHTVVKKWRDSGKYKSIYENHPEKLVELGIFVMERIPRWIRLNRFVRDFPGTLILGGNPVTNMRQVIHSEMKKQGKVCNDIREREVKFNTQFIQQARLTVRDYVSSGGTEYFISYETCNCKFCWKWWIHLFLYYLMKIFFITLLWNGCGHEDILYGFLRLRISNNSGTEVFPELHKSGLVRELHVYGKVVPKYKKRKNEGLPQHSGFGKKLLACAEDISKRNNKNSVAIISGTGVRKYYAKRGYNLSGIGDFMIKNLK